MDWLIAETSCSEFAAEQIAHYARAQIAAIGLLPSQKRVVFERFFDESGGMQLVVHAPFGGNVCRAWGFSMRKRFCRSFDFELQATADDDGFILSLGPQHSFPIESLFPMLTPGNARGLLEQAVLQVPLFQIRWRWNVTRSLLVQRMRNGKKVPPAIQRFRADDLLTAVFPKLTGCQEEHTGDHELPDHPLTRQTMQDCLTETLDVDGLIDVLGRIERGEIELIARDTREPSPFSYELLNANPYAFLDGGEFFERRARAVQTRRSLDVEDVRDLGRLDPEAIARVVAEARAPIRNADELHDLLLTRVLVPTHEIEAYDESIKQLLTGRRATWFALPDGRRALTATERWPLVRAAFPETVAETPIVVPEDVDENWSAVDARVAIVRGFIDSSGPVTAEQIASVTTFTVGQIESALEAIEGEGIVLRGRFTPHEASGGREPAVHDAPEEPVTDTGAAAFTEAPVEWCHRRLLSRIHRLTLQGLRRRIEPVGIDVFTRFLFRHHGLTGDDRRNGPDGLFEVLQMLQGLDVPAAAWEADVLPARLRDYDSKWLDELCLSGEVTWGRLFPPPRSTVRTSSTSTVSRAMPVSLLLREDAGWLAAFRRAKPDGDELPETVAAVFERLRESGALFATDLAEEFGLLPYQTSDVLGTLVGRGLITADGFSALRQLGRLDDRKRNTTRGGGAFRKRRPTSGAGRWSVRRTPPAAETGDRDAERAARAERVERWAWQLLRRWGVVFRELLDREQGAPRWFELLQVFRRLEARGEVRGGRFVAEVGGEQYALPHVVGVLRTLREDDVSNEEPVVISAADPLNLTGILNDGERVPATAGNRIAYRRGKPVAARQGGRTRVLDSETGSVDSELLVRTESARVSNPWATVRSFFEDSKNTAENPLDEDGRSRENESVGNPPVTDDGLKTRPAVT